MHLKVTKDCYVWIHMKLENMMTSSIAYENLLMKSSILLVFVYKTFRKQFEKKIILVPLAFSQQSLLHL